MAARGRKPGFRMSDEHRVKIQNSNILSALIKHATGDQEMTATQVTAGLGLLRKVLPDLSAVDMSVQGDVNYVINGQPLSEEEWLKQHGDDG